MSHLQQSKASNKSAEIRRHSFLLGLDSAATRRELVGTEVWVPIADEKDSITCEAFEKAVIRSLNELNDVAGGDQQDGKNYAPPSQQDFALEDLSVSKPILATLECYPRDAGLVPGGLSSSSKILENFDLRDCRNVNESPVAAASKSSKAGGADDAAGALQLAAGAANTGDILKLPFANDAAVLDCLRQRYYENKIYSFVKPMVVILNPYENLNNTSTEIIQQYHQLGSSPAPPNANVIPGSGGGGRASAEGKQGSHVGEAAVDLSTVEPHVFDLCRTAWQAQLQENCNISFIISGESGAGKTETTKHIMKYFATEMVLVLISLDPCPFSIAFLPPKRRSLV